MDAKLRIKPEPAIYRTRDLESLLEFVANNHLEARQDRRISRLQFCSGRAPADGGEKISKPGLRIDRKYRATKRSSEGGQ